MCVLDIIIYARSHHAPATRVAFVPLNRSTNHPAPLTLSKSTSFSASHRDNLAAALLLEDTPPDDAPEAAAIVRVRVSLRQNSLRALKQEV